MNNLDAKAGAARNFTGIPAQLKGKMRSRFQASQRTQLGIISAEKEERECVN
jgi:hypothetical protein